MALDDRLQCSGKFVNTSNIFKIKKWATYFRVRQAEKKVNFIGYVNLFDRIKIYSGLFLIKLVNLSHK